MNEDRLYQPANDSDFSLPKAARSVSMIFSILLQALDLTISCPQLRLNASCFSDQDGGVWVVMLHGRVCSFQEGSTEHD